jgi:glycosyltransferase involved in cell wall biosynthesis
VLALRLGSVSFGSQGDYSVPPQFSIITPSLRQFEWLKLCAASIADQEGVIVEHIVQDAGTGPELKAWAAGKLGLRLYVEEDRGMYDAVNRGFRRATGEILAYLNCDEQYLPGTLAIVADFFARNPDADVAFGNVVVVDTTGQYICSREASLPQLYHTWVCTLPAFTAATFFRRRIIDQHKLYFDDQWRELGDAIWFLELLKRKIRMAHLDRFLTAFTDTGENLMLKPNASVEQRRLRESAPPWAQTLRPFWILQHRLRRLVQGVYKPSKLTYSIFTRESPTKRQTFVVDKPKFIWPGRFGQG